MKWKFWKKPTNIEKMSFQETLDLTGIPIVTFRQGNKKFNFFLDTGANFSAINASVLSNLTHKESPMLSSGVCYGMDGIKHQTNFINADFTYRSNLFNDDFQVLDLTSAFQHLTKECGVTLHGILGNIFMQKYKYVLDFEEMIAYCKK